MLENVFGYFPSFLDAEILRIVLDRRGEGLQPTMETQINVFEMTSEVKDGKYVLKTRSIITFQFIDIDQLAVDGFNQKNVLCGLNIDDISDQQLEWLKFEVRFEGIFGVDFLFRCRDVKIVRVEPYSN